MGINPDCPTAGFHSNSSNTT